MAGTKHLQTNAPPGTCMACHNILVHSYQHQVSKLCDKSKPSMSHRSGTNCCILIAMSSIWKSNNFLSEACITPKCHPVSFSARSLMLWLYFCFTTKLAHFHASLDDCGCSRKAERRL